MLRMFVKVVVMHIVLFKIRAKVNSITWSKAVFRIKLLINSKMSCKKRTKQIQKKIRSLYIHMQGVANALCKPWPCKLQRWYSKYWADNTNILDSFCMQSDVLTFSDTTFKVTLLWVSQRGGSEKKRHVEHSNIKPDYFVFIFMLLITIGFDSSMQGLCRIQTGIFSRPYLFLSLCFLFVSDLSGLFTFARMSALRIPH